MTKKELWPAEGKLKKAILIFGIVVIAALLITLLDEKKNFRHTKRIPFVIALVCVAVWFYHPGKKEK